MSGVYSTEIQLTSNKGLIVTIISVTHKNPLKKTYTFYRIYDKVNSVFFFFCKLMVEKKKAAFSLICPLTSGNTHNSLSETEKKNLQSPHYF